MKIEDKAYFEKEWTEAGFSASFFIKKLQGMMAVYQGENDNEYRNKIIGYAKTLANHPDFVFNGVSSQALAKKAFALVKYKYARRGSKARFAKEYILWALPKGETDRLHERPIAEGLYTPAQVDDVKRKATAAGWHSFRVAAMMGFDDMTNAFKGKGIKKGNSRTRTKSKFAATRIWPNDYSEILNANAKYARLIFDRQKIIRANAGRRIKGEQPLEVPAPPTAPEFPFAFAGGDYVGLVLGGQANVPKGATVKWAHNANSIKMSRQGSKVRMGFLSGTKKQQIDYVFGVGTNYGERAWKSGIKRLIDDKEALARIRLLKYELDPSSPMRNTVDKEFDKGWLKGYTSQQIQESENPPKFKKGDKVLYDTGTTKHIGTIEKVSPYAKPEAEYIVAFTTLSTGRSQLNIPESSIKKFNALRTGTKTKFANRGAFAEASSSPVLGSLLEKKVMPEGGWRAVETDGAALVIAFEDNDIAGNFARRASENGYSATAPMAMAGRYWNVKVQNENKQ